MTGGASYALQMFNELVGVENVAIDTELRSGGN